MMTATHRWDVDFLEADSGGLASPGDRALIVLNQPFSAALLHRLWANARWRCCADGGANRLYDLFGGDDVDGSSRASFLPDLIKGDLDSLRDDVRAYYAAHEVPVVRDPDQNATDLMKCVYAIEERERSLQIPQTEIVILGGLSGRLDHTIHTLSYLHKLRKARSRAFVVTDDSIGWVLDAGDHEIQINHDLLGQTCGLLPVGINSTILTTSGLRWNLSEQVSSFDGLVSTSNHLVPEEKKVCIKTSKPIWWTVALKASGLKGIPS